MRTTTYRIVSLALALISGSVAAQIVNVQPLLPAAGEDGFSASIAGSADWRTGNTELMLLTGSLNLGYTLGKHQAFFMARGDLGLQGGEQFLSRDFEHLRYRYTFLPWAQGEVFAQRDRDPTRRLAFRGLFGIGPRFPVAKTETFELALGASYMLEFEQLQAGTLADSGQGTLGHRLSTYVMITKQLHERVRAGATVYLQPRVDRLSDLRSLATAELMLSLTEKLAVKFSGSMVYDSEPPIGLEPLDTVLLTSLQLAL